MNGSRNPHPKEVQHESRFVPHPQKTSAKQIAANRANAQRSTGPRTPEGKARARLNSLKHGLLASEAVNPAVDGDEARAQFDAEVDRLEDYYRPQGPLEETLVQKIAIATWRLKRLARFEQRAANNHNIRIKNERLRNRRWGDTDNDDPRAAMLAATGLGGLTLPATPDLMLLIRYEAAINRDFYRAINELRRLRKERATFESNAQGKDEAHATADAAQDPRRNGSVPRAKQNYQTNPISPSRNGADAVSARIEGEDPGGAAAGG